MLIEFGEAVPNWFGRVVQSSLSKVGCPGLLREDIRYNIENGMQMRGKRTCICFCNSWFIVYFYRLFARRRCVSWIHACLTSLYLISHEIALGLKGASLCLFGVHVPHLPRSREDKRVANTCTFLPLCSSVAQPRIKILSI